MCNLKSISHTPTPSSHTRWKIKPDARARTHLRSWNSRARIQSLAPIHARQGVVKKSHYHSRRAAIAAQKNSTGAIKHAQLVLLARGKSRGYDDNKSRLCSTPVSYDTPALYHSAALHTHTHRTARLRSRVRDPERTHRVKKRSSSSVCTYRVIVVPLSRELLLPFFSSPSSSFSRRV